jgi:hypothetical protein
MLNLRMTSRFAFRILAAGLGFLVAAGAYAQDAPRPRPPGTVPLEEPPPPPPIVEGDPALEPQITIRKDGERVVSEYRLRGKLYMIRVTPAHGIPYVLIDHRGDGQFSRQDSLDSGVRVPQWVLLEF